MTKENYCDAAEAKDSLERDCVWHKWDHAPPPADLQERVDFGYRLCHRLANEYLGERISIMKTEVYEEKRQGIFEIYDGSEGNTKTMEITYTRL